jgi:CubicO group peptidase (beta-lactamase class C family)
MLHKLALAALLSSLTFAQRITPPADAQAKVDRIFARYNSTSTPGCAVAAGIGGETVLSAGYGMADLEHDVRITPETVFEPGSVTKQFTAASVLLLAQQGKLSLDAPVRKYIPELPDYGTPITIRHLLNHTSGLRDWGNVAAIGGWPRTTRAYTHAHVLEIAARQRALNYPPGADYSYTNTGYNLAAILVGRVAGKPLAAFSRDAIFVPLDMNSTQWRDDFRRIVKNRAIAYSQSGNTFRTDMPFEDVHGNGGLLTTVGDLLRWNRNFTTQKVGGRALLDQQLQQGRLTDGSTIAYAAGLMVLHWHGLPEVSHSGSTAGYSAWLGRYPQQDLSVAVLCNVTTNATQLGHAVADVYLPPYRAAVPEPVAGSASQAGLYRSMRDHSVLTVRYQDGKLAIEGRGGLRPAFDAQGRLRISSEMDTILYEKVERSDPTSAELEAMIGDYASDEAEVTLTVKLEGDRLWIHRRPDAKIPLTPTYKDGFSSQLGSIRFLRDGSGKIAEMSLGESRVWDLRLRRLTAAR